MKKIHGSRRRSALLMAFSALLLLGQAFLRPDIAAQTGDTAALRFAADKGPADAPITIVEFSDTECPFCARASATVRELVQAYPAKIRLIFKHAPLPFHAKAKQAHEALLAAGAQGKFWEMHDLIFADQSKIEASDLIAHARRLKLDVAEFSRALETHVYAEAVERDLAEARALGVEAVPTFFINGRKIEGAQPLAAFKDIVDQDLGLKQPSAESAKGAPATSTIAAINTEGAPRRGPAQAPVTMVVFTDFQCPFCSRVIPTLEQVQQGYGDKVKLIFKSFPLDFHPDAQLAHEAAMAAGAQGKFWEMHDLIFANQRSLERADLLRFAEKINLDVKRFTADLDARKFRAAVEADKAEGAAAGVTGTPTIFINGKQLVGARPLAELRAAVEAEVPGAAWKEPNAPTVAANAPIAPTVRKREEFDPRTTKGVEDAPITLLWFSDIQSPLSPRAAQLIREVMDANPGKIHLVFKHRPLELRPNSIEIHEAALAAAARGKFWEMHDLLLADQKPLTRDEVIALAVKLGVSRAEISRALEGGTYRAQVEKDLAEARRREVRGSPVFFINNTRIDGLQPLKMFQDAIDGELHKNNKEAQALNSARE